MFRLIVCLTTLSASLEVGLAYGQITLTDFPYRQVDAHVSGGPLDVDYRFGGGDYSGFAYSNGYAISGAIGSARQETSLPELTGTIMSGTGYANLFIEAPGAEADINSNTRSHVDVDFKVVSGTYYLDVSVVSVGENMWPKFSALAEFSLTDETNSIVLAEFGANPFDVESGIENAIITLSSGITYRLYANADTYAAYDLEAGNYDSLAEFSFRLATFPEPTILAGDFDYDGTVDAADYTIWRDGLGSLYDQEEYEDWKATFGQTNGGGSSTTPIPEPSTLALFAIGCAAIGRRRRR